MYFERVGVRLFIYTKGGPHNLAWTNGHEKNFKPDALNIGCHIHQVLPKIILSLNKTNLILTKNELLNSLAMGPLATRNIFYTQSPLTIRNIFYA